MTTKTIPISCANKSIEFETEKQMSAQRHRIWLESRDPARGEAAAQQLAAEGRDVRAVAIDVASDDSVRAAAEHVQAEDGKLDVLINNAGIAGTRYPAANLPPIDDIRGAYETNVFGPIGVTQAFTPLLKAAGRANIVMVSSGLGSLGWLSDPGNPFYGFNLLGYNSSKTALNGVTVSFAKALAADGI